MNDENQWNNSRGQNHGSGYGGRKPSMQSYSDNKDKNYSPSTSFNYSQNGRSQGSNYQQNPRRRSDRFKRESINYNDKIVKQNDLIIRILKEIRDKLYGMEPGALDLSNKSEQSIVNDCNGDPGDANNRMDNENETLKSTSTVTENQETSGEDL